VEAPHRIRVKFFSQEPAAVELSAITPLFHRWIQEHRVDGLLLDVADYKHVQDGPGILLIGHEADYAWDLAGGRPGFVYDRKREWEADAPLAQRLQLVLRNGLAGCQALVADLAEPVHFKLDEAEISFLDRLRLPNEATVFEAVVAEIRPVLDDVYGQNRYTIAPTSEDPRRALTIHVHAQEAPALETLLARLQRHSPVAA
jgi:hypothetical protein